LNFCYSFASINNHVFFSSKNQPIRREVQKSIFWLVVSIFARISNFWWKNWYSQSQLRIFPTLFWLADFFKNSNQSIINWCNTVYYWKIKNIMAQSFPSKNKGISFLFLMENYFNIFHPVMDCFSLIKVNEIWNFF
jgi:hypothetical protein